MANLTNKYPDVHNFRCASFQSGVIQHYMKEFGMTKSEVIREMINGFSNYVENFNRKEFYYDEED